MGRLIVAAARFLLLCTVLLLILPSLMRSDRALAQQPTLAINPTQSPPGTIIPVLGNARQAITFLTQMITVAMQNGGEGQEAQLEALKQQIEALPKPKRGDRKAARLQHDKGLEEFKKEHYEQALQFFLTAYQLDAGDVEVVNNVGMAYLKTGNLPEAARYLGGALSLAPNRAAAWGNLAEVFAHDSRLEEATAAYALTYRYSKNKDATRRLLEAQTTNVYDPQAIQAAKAALALPLISGQTESGDGEYRGLAEKRLKGLPEPVPTSPQGQQSTIAASQPTPGKSGDPSTGSASCGVLEPPPVDVGYYERERQEKGNIIATWSGSCVNGLAQGTGTLTWHSEGALIFTDQFTGTNGLVMKAGRAAASDAVSERAVVWRLRLCPSQGKGVGIIREAYGIVSTDLNLAFPVVAARLMEFGVQFVARSCPGKKLDDIRIGLYQGVSTEQPLPGNARTAVEGMIGQERSTNLCGEGRSYSNKPCVDRLGSGVRAWVDAAEKHAYEGARARQEAEVERERQQVKQAAQLSRQRYDEFTQRAHIDVWLPSADVLQVNPFVYEGKVVGVVTQFVQMLTKDRGIFGNGLLVSSIPPGKLQKPGHLLLAGRVLGKEPVETPAGGRILMPHLQYEDIYICQANNPICDDVLLWQRQQ